MVLALTIAVPTFVKALYSVIVTGQPVMASFLGLSLHEEDISRTV